jgi:multidrug efflux system membrane fusion protein
MGRGSFLGPTAVTTDTVKVGTMAIFIDALGTVTPLQTVNVFSQVTGRVLSVKYQEGQIVKKGDLLVEIDRAPTEAQLQQAQGSLTRDKATLDQANLNLKRYQEAFAEKALAQQTVSDQEASLRQTQGTVQNDEGLVNYYQVQLGYYRIVAPLTGRIGLRLVDPGNTVFSGSGTTIATITQVTPITAVFSIAEDHLPQIRDRFAKASGGLVVDLYDRSQTKKIASGKLLTMDNQIDTSTGTVRLRALFQNDDGALFPNQFVNARLQVDVLDDAKLIPTIAVQYNGQQPFVYVMKPDSSVKIQNITVVNQEQKDSAIEGLEPGTTVVTSNFDRLTDGAKVSIAPAGGRDGGAPPAASGAASGMPPTR